MSLVLRGKQKQQKLGVKVFRRLVQNFMIAAVVVFVSMPQAASAAVTAQSVGGIPMYQYPTLGSMWGTVIAAGSQVPFIIANPASGPGVSVDSNYTTQITNSIAAGQRPIGYVDTSYQTRALADVVADIDQWDVLYPNIEGIFIDQVQNTSAAELCYLGYVHNYIKSKNPDFMVVQNFGAYVPASTEPYGDIFVNAENTYANYNSSWTLPADGFQDEPANSNRFLHMIHTADPGAEYTAALAKARNSNAGWVFITDRLMPNPYDDVPSYFSTLLTDVATLPAATIPNRGLTELPAGCVDMTQSVNLASTTSGSQTRTYSTTSTIANGASSQTAYRSKTSFSLPTGITLASASGTGWTCSGNECTFEAAIAASASSSTLSASFSVSCDYQSGDITVASTNFAGNSAGEYTISPLAPNDCPETTPTLAPTGESQNFALLCAGVLMGGSAIVAITLPREPRNRRMSFKK